MREPDTKQAKTLAYTDKMCRPFNWIVHFATVSRYARKIARVKITAPTIDRTVSPDGKPVAIARAWRRACDNCVLSSFYIVSRLHFVFRAREIIALDQYLDNETSATKSI